MVEVRQTDGMQTRLGTNTLWVLTVLVAWAPTRALAGDPLAYVRSSSQLDRATNPAGYHPLNLLDEDPATIWCEGSEGMGEKEEIRFFFKTKQRIDRVVVNPALSGGRLIQELRLTDGTNTVRVRVGENNVEKTLDRALNGTTITVVIDTVGAANKGSSLNADVACIADLLLYQGKKLFGGKATPEKLRYDAVRDKVLGRWAGEPFGAPEKFITFALDGTWEWNYTPLLAGKKERFMGEYRFRGDRLLMRRGETGRWADMRFKYKRVEVDPTEPGAPKGNYDLISLNEALEEGVQGEYNNAEF